jgi:hypothetical protein
MTKIYLHHSIFRRLSAWLTRKKLPEYTEYLSLAECVNKLGDEHDQMVQGIKELLGSDNAILDDISWKEANSAL